MSTSIIYRLLWSLVEKDLGYETLIKIRDNIPQLEEEARKLIDNHPDKPKPPFWRSTSGILVRDREKST
ncbi:hypothetical protein H6775_00400 [Candidatus Nomurabacteria bacterium]|nr:hypothetical protein [Candidatus Nomurabacteria bacterium]